MNYFEQIQGEREHQGQRLEENGVNPNFKLFNFDSFPAQTSTKKVLRTSKQPVKNSYRAINSYFEIIQSCDKGRPHSEKTKF